MERQFLSCRWGGGGKGMTYLRNSDRPAPGSDDVAWKRRRRQDDEAAESS